MDIRCECCGHSFECNPRILLGDDTTPETLEANECPECGTLPSDIDDLCEQERQEALDTEGEIKLDDKQMGDHYGF